jgi:hypothetical protein
MAIVQYMGIVRDSLVSAIRIFIQFHTKFATMIYKRLYDVRPGRNHIAIRTGMVLRSDDLYVYVRKITQRSLKHLKVVKTDISAYGKCNRKSSQTCNGCGIT